MRLDVRYQLSALQPWFPVIRCSATVISLFRHCYLAVFAADIALFFRGKDNLISLLHNFSFTLSAATASRPAVAGDANLPCLIVGSRPIAMRPGQVVAPGAIP